MLPEGKIKFEVDAWIGRRWVISDAVALELFAQYRGSSDYPFAGVGPTGLIHDSRGLLSDMSNVAKSLAGDTARLEEIDALSGWIWNWQSGHADDLPEGWISS